MEPQFAQRCAEFTQRIRGLFAAAVVYVSRYASTVLLLLDEGPNAGKAQVNPVLCKGCGLCVASCRSGALHLKGFEEEQLFAMINEM